MKNSPLPFAVTLAVICGFALSFLLDTPSGATGERVDTALEEYRIASQLVEQRDEALLVHDAQALAALTVEGSPARREDEALLASLDERLERLETVVMDVSVVSATVWDVTTVQYDYCVAGKRQNAPLPERCTRWILEPDPWRLADTADCAEQ